MPEYKFGRLQHTINLLIFGQLLERVLVVDRGGYPPDFIQALMVALYWSGFRISEWIGALPHKVLRKNGTVIYTETFPPLVKEQMWLELGSKLSCYFSPRAGPI